MSRRLATSLVAVAIGGGALLAAGAAASPKPNECVSRTSGSAAETICLVGPRVVDRNTTVKYVLSVKNTGAQTVKKLQLQLRPGANVTVKRASVRYRKRSGWDTWSYAKTPPGVTHRVTIKLAFGERPPGMSHWVETDRTRIAGKTFLYQSVSFAQKRK
jgi:hypothetical protein